MRSQVRGASWPLWGAKRTRRAAARWRAGGRCGSGPDASARAAGRARSWHHSSLSPPDRFAVLDYAGHDLTGDVVREIAPVVGAEEDDVGVVARGESSLPVGAGEDMGCVDRTRRERFGR